MKIRCCGTSGSVSVSHDTISFLINDKIALDAGSLCRYLTLEEQAKIDSILVTHAHLDHIKSICFLADNILSIRKNPVSIYGSDEVLRDLKKYLLNDVIWPDFTRILNYGGTPVLELAPLRKGLVLGDISVNAVPVNHSPGAVGYILTDGGESWIFGGDSGSTHDLWQACHQLNNLQGIIVDVSFPNRLRSIADKSRHLCPATFQEEIAKMPTGVPIFVHHLKPQFRTETIQEILAIGNPMIKILSDGQYIENFSKAA